MNYLEDKTKKISDTRVIILLGDNIVDGRNRDGEVDVCLKDKNNAFDYHALALDSYLQNHFKDKENVQNADKLDPNSMAYSLTKENAIVAFENTSFRNNNSILLFVPDLNKISEKQSKSLKNLQQKLKDENYELSIYFNLQHHPEDYTLTACSKIGNFSILNYFINSNKTQSDHEENDNFER